MIAFNIRLSYVRLGRIVDGNDDTVIKEHLFGLMHIGHALGFIVRRLSPANQFVIGRIVILGIVFLVRKDVEEGHGVGIIGNPRSRQPGSPPAPGMP